MNFSADPYILKFTICNIRLNRLFYESHKNASNIYDQLLSWEYVFTQPSTSDRMWHQINF